MRVFTSRKDWKSAKAQFIAKTISTYQRDDNGSFHVGLEVTVLGSVTPRDS